MSPEVIAQLLQKNLAGSEEKDRNTWWNFFILWIVIIGIMLVIVSLTVKIWNLQGAMVQVKNQQRQSKTQQRKNRNLLAPYEYQVVGKKPETSQVW